MSLFIRRLVILPLFTAAGCAVEVPPAPPPGPSSFKIDAAATVNLTPQLQAQTGLPATVKAALHADAAAEAIPPAPADSPSDSPARSRQAGHLTLVVTGDPGGPPLAEVHVTVDGESDGSPDEALLKIVGRFTDAATLMTRPFAPPLATTPQATPGDQTPY